MYQSLGGLAKTHNHMFHFWCYKPHTTFLLFAFIFALNDWMFFKTFKSEIGKSIVYFPTYLHSWCSSCLCVDPSFHLLSFSFTWKISFSISYSRDLPVMNSLSFCLKTNFILPSFWKEIFLEYRILSWQFCFSFSTLKMSCTGFLTCTFSDKKLVITLCSSPRSNIISFLWLFEDFLFITGFSAVWLLWVF